MLKTSDAIDIVGSWFNQHGSELRIENIDEGRITGRFDSPTGLGQEAHPGRVSGFVSGTLVSIVADFGKFGSMTAWSGHLVNEDRELVLETQWQMAVLLPHPKRASDLWRGTWVGSDTFRRQRVSDDSPDWLPSHPVPDWR
jgi:hypothetical protein